MTKISDFFIDETETKALKILCEICYNENVSDEIFHFILSCVLEEIENPKQNFNYYYNYFKNLDDKNINLDYDEKFIKYFQKYVRDRNGLYEFEYEDNKFILLDFKDKKIKHKKVSYSRDKMNTVHTTIIDAVPTFYNRNKNIFTKKYTHKVVWETDYEKEPFVTNSTRDNLKKFLENKNYIFIDRYLNVALTSMMRILFNKHRFKDTEDIESPGFYIHPETNKNFKIDYTLPFFHENIEDITDDDIQLLNEGVECLEYLFNNSEWDKVKLGWVFRWFLVAPFGFMKKQTHNDYFRWLYLWGDSGAGKTTLCKIFAHMWDKYDTKIHVTGGSTINTQYRLGARIELSTYPILVSETKQVFKGESLGEMLKFAIESEISRSRDEDGEYVSHPAFSCLAIASNFKLPSTDAFRNRFVSFGFNRDEILKNMDFIRDLGVGKPNSKLQALKGIGAFVSCIMNDRKMLEFDGNYLSKKLVKTIYRIVGRVPPRELLIDFPVAEDKESLADEKIDKFKEFFLKRINDSIRGLSYHEDISSFQARLQVAIDNETINWLRQDSNNNIIFKKAIVDEFEEDISLKSLALLLGDEFEWKPKTFNNKTHRAIVVNKNVFLKWMDVRHDNDIEIEVE